MQRILLFGLGLTFVLAGCAVAVYGGLRYFEEQSFLGRSESATGRVTRNQMRAAGGGRVEFCPDLEFTTREGRSVKFSGGDRDCAYTSKYKVGQEVTVFYDPAEPTRAQVESFANTSGDLLTGCILFVFLTGLGLMIGVLAARSRKSASARS